MESNGSRVFPILGVMLASSASLALADDGSDGSSKTVAVSAPTAPEFLPMTRSERHRNYLLDVGGPESIVSAAAYAATRRAENSPKEWRGGAEGYGYRIGDAFAQHVIRGTLQLAPRRFLRIAQRNGKTDAVELLKAAALRLLDEEERFHAAVLEGEAYADRGGFIQEEETDARLEQMLRS